jgi:Taurine catabolism dioxygenase TauD, TfdA family
MAPGITENQPVAAHQLDGASKAIFPDGIKTSGQHPPLYAQLKSFEDFPKEIVGPTVWEAKDYTNNPERWVHHFDAGEIVELSQSADNFIASGTPLTGISQSNFPLPQLSKLLKSVRHELVDGKGFILFKGFPVDDWGNHKSAVAYMGLGTYLGYFVSQNGRGHVLGHVKDLGEDSARIDKVRIYRTNARWVPELRFSAIISTHALSLGNSFILTIATLLVCFASRGHWRAASRTSSRLIISTTS